jgi:Protein of unknown function (DUF3306)
MSDEEFLTRWSRRKREANTAVEAPRPAGEPQDAPLSGTPETPADTEFDLSSLPPIESITGATDITAFLRKGIPAELSRAALRRAWASDPAIRDFIGLAENAWDFNDPNAMPGFGPLDCSEEQLAALLERVVGGVRSAADHLATGIPEQQDSHRSADHEPLGQEPLDQEPLLEPRASEAVAEIIPPSQEVFTGRVPVPPVAVQLEIPRSIKVNQASARPRTHGRALPR